MDGTPPPATPTSPSACTDARGFWAGSSLHFAALAVEVSDDGSTLLRCAGACTFLRVKDGAVVARVEPANVVDGQRVEEKPEVQAAMAKYGFTSTERTWPVPDAFLDWSLAPRGSAVTYWLRDRVTSARLALGRFQSKTQYVFPAEATWSGNGLALVLLAWLDVELTDAVVDLPAARALLYLRAYEIAQTEATRTRARRACDTLSSRVL
jgi:hypothetical protein